MLQFIENQKPVSNAAAASCTAFVCADPASTKLLELARRVAVAGVTTLITGSTGVGKEVLARVVHEASPRRHRPFVALNCAALPESMVEDILFGHEKGAFTGALREHVGLFEQADGGSLFLDEISEMPYTLQGKLLRVIQERQVTRIGAQGSLPVDVRLIAATNRDLRQAIRSREFREDLYFRISTFRLRIPPLAERVDDILPLCRHFLALHSSADQPRRLAPDARDRLVGYAWPGNVRELSNVIQRALVLCTDSLIRAEHLQFEDDAMDDGFVTPGDAVGFGGDPDSRGAGLRGALRTSEQQAIEAALQGSQSREQAARVLGISPRTLRYKLARMRQDDGLSLNRE